MRAIKYIIVLLLISGYAYAGNIQPSQIEWLGSFKLNTLDTNSSDWKDGGFALGHIPTGDPTNTDDYSGSLVSAGQYNDGNSARYVSEFKIPVPIKDACTGLNTAATLQTFTDITDGKLAAEMPGEKGGRVRMQGLVYLAAQGEQSEPMLYFSFWDWYNVGGDNDRSVGYSNLDFSSITAHGPWHGKDSVVPNAHAGYLFDIPEAWATTYAGGKRIFQGQCRTGTIGAVAGPSLIAIDPYNYTDSSPPTNDDLNGTIGLLYGNKDSGNELTDYTEKDTFRGGAFLEVGSDNAIVLVGQKGLGHNWYGDPTDGEYTDPCHTDGGEFHNEDYAFRLMFYSTADIAAVLAGTDEDYEPQPYASLDLDDANTLLARCSEARGMAYDRTNNYIYIISKGASACNYLAYVHVYKLNAGAAKNTLIGKGTPVTISATGASAVSY